MSSSADVLRTPGLAQALTDGASALDQAIRDAATITGLQTSLAAAAAQHVADLQKIADLEAQINPVPPPPPPPPVKTGLVLGLDTTTWSTAGVAAQRKMIGGRPLANCRVFFGPGKNPTWADNQLQVLTPADRPFPSAKTISEATLTAFLDTMPAAYKIPGTVYKFAIRHEDEANCYDSGDYKGAVATYLAEHAMAQTLFAQHPNGRFFELWKIGLRYSQVLDSKRGLNKGSWKDFVGDQDIPYGMDCYWEKQFPNYDPPEVLFAKLLEIHAATGLRVGVPEWGGITVGGQRNDPGGVKRAAAITAGIAYLRTTPIEYASWWNGTGAAGDHRLDPFPSNVAAWAAGMALNP